MSKIYKINNHLMEYNNNCIDDIGAMPIPAGIKIGSQIWATTNLNYDDGEGGIVIVDNVTANGVNFGTQYYYTWYAANRVANKIQGWHLPSKAEWWTLISYVGGYYAGSKLKSTYGWNNDKNGTDDYGFCGLPVGTYVDGLFDGEIRNCGHSTYFWPSDAASISDAYYVYLYIGDGVDTTDTTDKSDRFSVRLIKD